MGDPAYQALALYGRSGNRIAAKPPARQMGKPVTHRHSPTEECRSAASGRLARCSSRPSPIGRSATGCCRRAGGRVAAMRTKLARAVATVSAKRCPSRCSDRSIRRVEPDPSGPIWAPLPGRTPSESIVRLGQAEALLDDCYRLQPLLLPLASAISRQRTKCSTLNGLLR